MEQAAGLPAEPGLRERKKRATRLALQRAALELVSEHGREAVTVEQIAAAADVSTRTFFNYFATKDDALAATDPELLDEVCAAVTARPPDESPLRALREVSLDRGRQIAADTGFWKLRGEVIRAHPDLAARLVGASVAADHRVARALADRMGVDPRRDPRPLLVASAVTVAKRTAVEIWLATGQERDLIDILTDCLDALAHLDDA